MIKKLLTFLFMILMIPAQAAQVVNVEYVHNAIKNKWDITIPYNPALVSPNVAANMKYVLTAVDVANKMLGGESNYASGEYATNQVADTVAVDTVVKNLIRQNTTPPDISGEDVYDDGITSPEYPFAMGLVDGTTEFTFLLTAAGQFVIDWGDGYTETISKSDVSEKEIIHRYDAPGAYVVKIGGRATQYDKNVFPSAWVPAISAIWVTDYWSLAKLYGRLGRVFATLEDGTQPSFAGAFMYCDALTTIPETLFDGITGNVDDYMFYSMFEGAERLSEIPNELFDGLTGELKTGVFKYMFSDCYGLGGDSAKINGEYLYNRWPNATTEQVGGMYMNDTGLSDYSAIPDTWK